MPDEKTLQYLRRVTTELQEARNRIKELEHSDPIVVVGMGCRFPGGVSSPEDLWELVAEGRDAISAAPGLAGWDLAELVDPDPAAPARPTPARAASCTTPADFDADVLRHLARVRRSRWTRSSGCCWRSPGRRSSTAGIDPGSLRGSDTGVFVGAMHRRTTHAAGRRARRARRPSRDRHRRERRRPAASPTRSGCEGPAVTVDTACSSSLVALHLAVQALRQRRVLARAGRRRDGDGHARPRSSSSRRQRGLAPDGRCKAFSAAADGTAWAEGAACCVLERLSDARRNGHRVLAVDRAARPSTRTARPTA